MINLVFINTLAKQEPTHNIKQCREIACQLIQT